MVPFEVYPATTGAAIVRIEIRMVDDGQKPWLYEYPAGMNYATNRGFQPKPAINGLWRVEVKAIDTNGCVGVGLSSTYVRVFQ